MDNARLEMNSLLFNEIINTAQDCVFWKDTERRFVGVNQAFLDYYGFESPDVLIGRTDEDMGWHSDPEPFKKDELEVLAGKSTYKVQGKCMMRGQERDIIASKRPIYDNNKVVGLVGSFVDVTDVIKRQANMEGAQIMYDLGELRKYQYFDRILDETPLNEVLDPLTGTIGRAHIIECAKWLIASGTPFTYTILDLDNFKHINDTYGHRAGDEALMEITRGLADHLRGYGLVGRFGGDELLLINLRDIKTEDKNNFFKELYEGHKVLRKTVKLDGNDVFLTGTAGCATYPNDAESYDEIFSMMDKTLYRGKNKGRNCYVIYDREKHENLTVEKVSKIGIYKGMVELKELFDRREDPKDKLMDVMSFLQEHIKITELYFVDDKGILHAVYDPSVSEDVNDISNLVHDPVITGLSPEELKGSSPLLYWALRKRDVHSYMIVRISGHKKELGYLICAEPNSHRLWQEDECALMFFLSELISSDR